MEQPDRGDSSAVTTACCQCLRNNLAPSGHVSNLRPAGIVILPVDAYVFRLIRANRRRDDARHPVWTRLELAGIEPNLLVGVLNSRDTAPDFPEDCRLDRELGWPVDSQNTDCF